MSTFYIAEAQGVGKRSAADIQAAMLPFVTIQRVTFTGTAGYSAAVQSSTGVVRLWADAQCSFLASTAASAAVASNTLPMAALTAEYFSVPPNGTIYFSVISNS